MSEYQYYEFAAIDRPLTPAEIAKLRALSTRAEITPTGFVNHYEWGDLKADPDDWLRRYFNAFVYTANWCSCRFSVRVPLATYPRTLLKAFMAQDTLTVRATKTHWIVDWTLDDGQDHERFALDDGHNWMRRLLPLRDELLRGDLRPLYLGWLAAAAAGGVSGAALEPAVPGGLAVLSPAQRALTEFLELDANLLASARTGHARPARRQQSVRYDDRDAWLGTWSRDELVAVVKMLASGQAHAAERQVRLQLASWNASRRETATPKRRCSAAELLEAAGRTPRRRPKRG